MISKNILCLDYDLAKEKADSVREMDDAKYIYLTFSYKIQGDTGKYFNVELRLGALKPHPDYPDHLLVFNSRRDGKGVSKYFEQCKRRENNLFSRIKKDLPPVTLEGESLIGVREIDTKTESGRKTSRYEHYFYEPKDVNERPVATEMYKAKLQSRIRRYSVMPSDYSHEPRKYNYFQIDGEYFEGYGDPIQDVVSGESQKRKKELLDTMNNLLPVKGTDKEIEGIFPKYIYKGYIGLKYFSKNIYFNDSLDSLLDNYEYKIIVPPVDKKSSFSKMRGFETFQQFIFAYKDNEKYKEKIKNIKVYNEALLGKPLREFEDGDIVVIENPTERHKVLENLEGKVVGKKGDKTMVEFLNFSGFREGFSSDELILKEEINNKETA